MRFLTRALGVFGTILLTNAGMALPIGFGTNQSGKPYAEVKTPNFIVYHDARAPSEALAVTLALEESRSILEQWLQVKRQRPLPVIMSAVSDYASFANFITDAIELQTLGQGGRDLAWHEYTHSSMYRHLDNWLGPAGAVIHLPFMPAWWIEGLAEAISRSVPSDMAAGIERHFALHGGWPSYEKLHSLYGQGGFALEGYAVSGNFVSYLLRTRDANKLPEVLRDFYRYSMPWWWPWSIVPFNDFLPMDEALRRWTGKDGRALYEEYKAAAIQHWQAAGPSLVSDSMGALFGSASALEVRGDPALRCQQDADREVRRDEAICTHRRQAIRRRQVDVAEGTLTIDTGRHAGPLHNVRQGLAQGCTHLVGPPGRFARCHLP